MFSLGSGIWGGVMAGVTISVLSNLGGVTISALPILGVTTPISLSWTPEAHLGIGLACVHPPQTWSSLRTLALGPGPSQWSRRGRRIDNVKFKILLSNVGSRRV